MISNPASGPPAGPPSPPTHQLKLFNPAGGDNPPLADAATLYQFYQSFVRPVVLRTARPRNIAEYDASLAYWRDFTGDPPLQSIDERDTIPAFLAGLESARGKKPGTLMTPATRHKHCRTVQRVLDLAGPRSRATPRLRQAQGLLADVPYIERPKLLDQPPHGIFTLDEIAALLASAPSFPLPRACPRDVRGPFWTCLIALGYNTALRIGSLRELRWSWIAGECLRIPADPDVYKGGRYHHVPLNASARQALDAWRVVAPPGDAMFPWQRWFSNATSIHRTFGKLAAAAGLPPDRQFNFKGLRKRSLTETARIDPRAAQTLGGHTTSRTTETYYTERQVALDRAAQVLSQLPQPGNP